MRLPRLWWEKHTYCRVCELLYPLDTVRCAECNKLVKRTPFSNKTRGKDLKYIE